MKSTTANLEIEVRAIEEQLKTLKQTNLFKLERKINHLLFILGDTQEPQHREIKERLFTVLATATITLALIKNPSITWTSTFTQPKQEQLSPSVGFTVSKPVSKPVAEPVAKPSTFALQVKQVAARIGADPVDLLTLMSFETAGTLNPAIRGPHVPGQGRAVGLIQFMPSTARELGTSVEQLATMTPIEQLDYVEKYLVKRGYRGGSLKKLYSTVFAGHPNAPGTISDGYHTLDSAVARMNREHRQRAIALLNGTSPYSQTKAIINSWAAEYQNDPKTGDKIAGYVVTSPRGMRHHPITKAQTFHEGVDIATPVGTPLYAIAPGEVSCWNDDGGGGLVASFKSETFPGLQFDLLHLSECVLRVGQTKSVNAGVAIAKTGNSGASTGPHLDLRIKDLATGKRLRVRSGWLYWFLTGVKP